MTLLRRGERPERRGTPADWLVLGLGNPGAEYARSRHNVGAEAVEELARRCGIALTRSRERALVTETTMSGCRVALARPLTYMNDSGDAGQLLVRRHGIADAGRIVLVHAELDLPPGALKVKVGGGLAGHNGLRSLRQHLHTADFVRVRIGVGKPPSKDRGADHVLRRLGRKEREELDVAVQRAADAVEMIVAEGPAAAMTRFNAG